MQKILDSMMKTLHRPGRKFVFHDVGFVRMYWERLGPKQRLQLRLFVQKRKLEIVNCGVSMNDALLPLFSDVLANFKSGRQWCREQLDFRPTTAWFVDSFGFNNVSARLLEDLGFENLVINRIDYREKARRAREGRLMFAWKTGKAAGLRTVVLGSHYNGSDFSVATERWVYDDPFTSIFNLFDKYQQMKKDFLALRLSQGGPLLFDLYGDDFTHMDFEATVGSYEKLIAFNRYNPRRSDGFNINFATAAEYFRDLEALAPKKKLPAENPNFVPYIDRPAEFWVGFYSTRPKTKFDLVKSAASYRALQHLLVVGFVQTRKLRNATDFGPAFAGHVAFIENMIGIYLHHDAITATSVSLVIADYLKKVKSVGSRFSQLLRQSEYFNSFLQRQTGQNSKAFFDYYFCNWAETGSCLLNKFAKENSPLLVLFNPAYRRRLTDFITLPSPELMLYDANNAQVENYIHCMTQFKTGSCKMFYQVDLQSSELKLLRLKTLEHRKGYVLQSSLVSHCRLFVLEHDLKLKVNCTERPDEVLVQLQDQPEFSLNVSMREYLTKDSGPYIFKPAFGFRHSPRPLEDSALLLIEFVDSPVALEVRFVYAQHWTVLRYVKRSRNAGAFGLNLELELFLRSQALKNDNRIYTGKELLIEFKTSFVDNADFFYSQNGLDVERVPLPRFKEYVNDIVDDFGLGGCKPL